MWKVARGGRRGESAPLPLSRSPPHRSPLSRSPPHRSPLSRSPPHRSLLTGSPPHHRQRPPLRGSSRFSRCAALGPFPVRLLPPLHRPLPCPFAPLQRFEQEATADAELRAILHVHVFLTGMPKNTDSRAMLLHFALDAFFADHQEDCVRRGGEWGGRMA